MWNKSVLSAYMKYDIRILRPQCMRCNIDLGGMGAVFFERMCEEIGIDGMKKLQEDRKVTVKAYDHYLTLIPTYEEILNDLQNNQKDVSHLQY